MSEHEIQNGDYCRVVAGTHRGKTVWVQDKNMSKTGHITITVLQTNGVRFKTLGKNVEIIQNPNTCGSLS